VETLSGEKKKKLVFTLQGKYIAPKVIVEFFSVTKLEKIVKKRSLKHLFLVADVFVEIITKIHYKLKNMGGQRF